MTKQDTPVEAHDVLEFWFGELTEEDYWTSNNQLDNLIRTRFAQTLGAASVGKLWQWRESAEGRLAEIIVLDQFSRNIHRGSGSAYENDPVAVILAQEAVATGADRMIEESKRRFMYLPFMHSESLTIHRWSWPMFEQLDENTLKFKKFMSISLNVSDATHIEMSLSDVGQRQKKPNIFRTRTNRFSDW